MRSLRLAGIEIKRLLTDTPLVRAAVVAITLVPLLYGALYLWAFWDPYGNLNKMPVALVNLDTAVTVDGEQLTAGADLTKELIDRNTFAWKTVSAQEASEGVQSGRYYLSLTIPADFSANLATANSKNPTRARLLAVAHESSNMLASSIAERAFVEVSDAAGQSASKRYLDKIFVGFADAHGGFSDAAAGAKDLASGLKDGRDGARKLAGGTSSARDGAGTLATGLVALKAGATKADAGAQTVAGGNKSLAAGLADARSGATQVAGGADQLAGGTTQLAGSLGQLSAGADKLSTSAGDLADGAKQLKSGVNSALSQVGQAADGAKQVHDGATGVDSALQAYLASNPSAADDPAFKQALAAAGQVEAGSEQLEAGLADAATQGPALATGASKLSAGADQLAGGAQQLAGGLTLANGGAEKIASGAHDLAGGSAQLFAGVRTAAGGASKLADGSTKLASGTHSLANGAKTAAAGAGALSVGVARLDAGAHDLASGLAPAVSGSNELASGLTAGADAVPSYSKTIQASNAEMMSAPVELTTVKMGAVPKYGIGFAPYFVPLALWIGALLAFFLVSPLPERALASGAPAPITALAGYLPAAALGTAQALILLVVVELALGLQPANQLALYGITVLTALVFVAILQFLNAALGTVGKLVSIILLMLQLTSAAGTFPIQTVPSFFQAINPYLPMTYVVAGLRQAISGGDMTSLAREAAILAVFGAVAFMGTMVAAQRDQVWSMERLHPSLEL